MAGLSLKITSKQLKPSTLLPIFGRETYWPKRRLSIQTIKKYFMGLLCVKNLTNPYPPWSKYSTINTAQYLNRKVITTSELSIHNPLFQCIGESTHPALKSTDKLYISTLTFMNSHNALSGRLTDTKIANFLTYLHNEINRNINLTFHSRYI